MVTGSRALGNMFASARSQPGAGKPVLQVALPKRAGQYRQANNQRPDQRPGPEHASQRLEHHHEHRCQQHGRPRQCPAKRPAGARPEHRPHQRARKARRAPVGTNHPQVADGFTDAGAPSRLCQLLPTARPCPSIRALQFGNGRSCIAFDFSSSGDQPVPRFALPCRSFGKSARAWRAENLVFLRARNPKPGPEGRPWKSPPDGCEAAAN